ncbi:MAG: Ig domain-containing protein, partial [Lachnospiraceae bacterium]|nr:Ig domain-containing protein [Lachnospiraceae bacterium]
MVELQGNMKKGSLKRFLAMFLVFCMSVSNFYVNESYAQAAESQETKWNATVTITSQDGKTTIKTGEKLQLSAKVDYVLSTDDTATPDVVATNDAAVPASNENAQKVIWTTSNDKVATVVDGLVEGKAKGEAVITAASVLAPQKSASFKITVQEDDTQKPPVDDDKKPPVVDDDKKPPVAPPVSNKVTGVTLNKKSVSVNKGKSVKLTASVAPANAANKAVTWSSDKKNIATVDKNGNVKGIKKGTANITVTTKEGNFKAVCKVSVKVPATKVTVNVNTQNITLKKGRTANAAAYVTPSDSTDKISWSSKNKKVATV